MPTDFQKKSKFFIIGAEKEDIVHRTVYPVVPPKVEYSLTKQGKSVMPILDIMCNWGTDYYESVITDKKE